MNGPNLSSHPPVLHLVLLKKNMAASYHAVKGDWTGYWEDGSGSSAFETGQNRNSSSRLTQAETVWAMANPEKFPVS